MSKELIIETQAELDAIKPDFEGTIYIEGGSYLSPLVLRTSFEEAGVIVRGEAWLVARETSHVVARGTSHVVARGTCHGYNVISLRKANQKNVTVVMNDDSYLKIVPDFEPTFEAYQRWYPFEVKGKKAILYKAVHKRDGKYVADYDNTFVYEIGKKVSADCDPKQDNSCSFGLHVAYKSWAIGFGSDWDDEALLECEVPIDKIVVSKDCDGKVRTSDLKVLREVPRSEWWND